jgi:hypothetical protein
MTQNSETGKIPTIDEFWAKYQKTIEDNERFYEESKRRSEELNKKMEEAAEERKRTDRIVGELSNRFGELAEHLVGPSIKEKFNALGFTFDAMSRDLEITSKDGKSYAEIDIFLENGDVAIAVEIKSKLLQKDVDAHIKRMEILKAYSAHRQDKRKFRGALAGAIVTKEVKEYALKTGFYVIEQTGDTVKIAAPSDSNLREW